MLYPLIRKFFFSLDAETAHGIGMKGIDLMNAAGLACAVAKPVAACPVEVMGLKFPNPVGLAAGLDKNGDHIDGLAKLGFGFIEIGTITPRPQDGNPKPRLFRIPEAQGIINRMGFNNAGVDKLLENVRAAEFPKKGGILGINIGKNATTPIEKAADDYLICLDKVYNDASYVTVNISSPNTKNLRELQKDEALDDLLAQLKAKQLQLAEQYGKYVPMALKIAPDLDDEQITAIADALRRHRFDAVIATNTTLSREGVEGMPNATETGGLSGKPVFEKSTAVQKKLSIALAGELPIIGVGGIMGGEDAAEKIRAGASLVQFYSGFIYRGPDLVSEVAETLAHVMRKSV
ncbi:MAG: dihydroorotate oxidase [Proteobacteria bacterium]|uniref:Dihydroorotate dehydrogenase (quinone) n=1 Tax=Dechloromonas aromatica (strain RCB) TaxID=159087 RepID=PYRD_DECAR|nr:RecName: Full=Dihydroorotate dehydrogenase (quinone); AltName: Full=DHOdehase; Short=DHOD; Short=DHODase; AltName: Full=Dihydroorotate oxidase [Dechloromonas aromatica RCB]MBS1129124.1 dihydroorotate oxidase [Pseudomonadota bacterium]